MKPTRIVIPALIVLLGAGVWLFVAPFGVGYQLLGAPWTTATVNDLATGGALVVIALAGLVTYAALAARDLLRRGNATGPGDPVESPAGERAVSGQ